jgi:hypothetical protein
MQAAAFPVLGYKRDNSVDSGYLGFAPRTARSGMALR